MHLLGRSAPNYRRSPQEVTQRTIIPDTDISLGTLADSALRAVLNRCRAVFHKHIPDTGMGRTQAYRWLAEQMQIDVGVCHFGWFEQADCERAEALVEAAVPQTAMAMAFANAR
ncbi:zinc-finger-containing protein [Pseudomonas fulva]|uniref:zinc-finger-containing protein n=1 Tax=Pseudomonas fulva TaxID=47880 RepID=UPI00244C497E|nr:zinc-finger-containing protein [Pseudomonas fulva]MDH0618288.1 DUF3268 family zinc-finger domain-containing protein [Pseudomonas fulva]